MLKWRDVGKKQAGDNARWQYVWDHIAQIKTEAETRALVEHTAAEVETFTRGKTVAYAWSGGKDSIALQIVMELIGINRCVLGMTRELEYPEFLQWATDNMPWGLDVIETGLTYQWLSSHQDMLFPSESTTAAKWFKLIQHKAQAAFYERYELDMIILGRRHADGNYTGKDGTGIYTDRDGVTRYSPIRHWSHEEVLAACYYYQKPLPPFYRWINGWVVGTGCWPARQWTNGNGWAEIWQIDPSIVYKAAGYLPGAKQFLETV